jgi:hypothetical protein
MRGGQLLHLNKDGSDHVHRHDPDSGYIWSYVRRDYAGAIFRAKSLATGRSWWFHREHFNQTQQEQDDDQD